MNLDTGQRSTVCLLLSLLAVTVPAASSAGPGATVTFDPLNGVFTGNDTLTVQVTVDAGAVDLRGFTMVLEFDPSIVTPVSIEAGSLVTGAACTHFFTWLNSAAIGDSLDIDAATLGCSIDGPGNIVEMKFVGEALGISPVACRSVELRDSKNQTIPSTCIDGTIEYQLVIAVEENTWGRIKAGYRH
jgi:hypothetical protein